MITHKVSKTSGRESLKLFRRLAVAFVLFFVMQAGWGETYYWTGAEGDGKWSTSGNWNTAPDGSGTTLTSGYPNGYDNVRFPKGAEINVDVTTNEIDGTNYLFLTSLQIPNNNIENSDFTVKLTGYPIYISNSFEIYRATGPTAGASKSTLELACNIVIPELIIHPGTTVQIDSGYIVNTGTVSNVGDNEYPAIIDVRGSLTSQEIKLSNNSDRTLEIASGGRVETGKITGTNNSVTNNGSLSITNVNGSNIGVLKAGGNGTLELNGANTCIWKGTEDEDWGNANNWIGGVPNSNDANVILQNGSYSPEIKAGDAFEILSYTNEGSSIFNIEGSLKIYNDLNLYNSGIAFDSGGTLEITGKLYNSSPYDYYGYSCPILSIICGDFEIYRDFECRDLIVKGNAVIAGTITTDWSQEYQRNVSGKIEDVINDVSLECRGYDGGQGVATIKGSISDIKDFSIEAHDGIVIEGAITGITNLEFDCNTNADILIKETVSNVENLTILTCNSAEFSKTVSISDELNLYSTTIFHDDVEVGGDFFGSFVSDTGKKFVLNGTEDQAFRTCGDPYYNHDGFTYSTIEIDKASGSMIIGNEYYDYDTITNCTIKNAVETTFENIKVTNLTIENIGDSSKTIFDSNVKIETLTDSSNSGDIVFKENSYSVIIENISTDQTFKTTGTLKFDSNSNPEFGDESELKAIKHVAGPTEIKGWISAFSVEFDESAISYEIETSGNQKYLGAVSINMEGIELHSTNGDISFNSTIKAASDGDMSLVVIANGTTTFAGSIGQDNKALKCLVVDSPLEIASGCTAITTADYQEYYDIVTINENVTLKSDETITFDSTIDSKTDTTKKITFEVPTDKAISVDGKVGNSKPVALEVTQAKSITFNDTVNITEFTDTAASGDIIFKKDATISNASGTTFSTTGTVTFGNAPSDVTTFGTSPSPLAALTHSTGPTVLNGTLNASSVTLGNTNATPGTISIPSGTINASGTVTLNGALTSIDSVSITAGPLAFNAPVEVKNITMNAVAETSQDFTVTGNWTNNKAKNGTTYGFTATGGTVTFTRENPTDSTEVLISGENKFNELEILRSVKITADNEITTLTADGGSSGLGGKTITFADSTTQTVTGTMSLKGTSSDSNLVLYANEGEEWKIDCTGSNNHTIQYVDVYNSNNLSSYNLVALNSSDKGHNTKWTFPGEDYEWTGEDSTDNTNWNVAANWSPASVPGLGADVTIPTGKLSYPIISSSINLYYDADNKGSITNNGTITFTESGSITADTKENGSGSTIIYDGSFTNATTLAWGYEYENLTFTSGTFNLSDALSVNNFTIGNTAEVSTSANITVTGNWTNNNSADGFTATGGTVKLTTASNDTTRATLSGANTFYNLNLDRNIAVLGSNTISQDLIMHRTAGDADAKGNIYFAANTKQTIGGKIDYKGLTTKRLLADCGNATGQTNGTWEIKCTGSNNHELQNINLKGCRNSSGYPLVVQDPDGTQENGKSKDNGGNTNFYFLNHAYTWQGGADESDTNWGTASYWTPASVPGKGSVVTIPAGKKSYPVLTDALDLKYNNTYAGSITIDDGGKFDLADKSLTVGTITNNGLVRLKGSASQIDGTVDNGTSDSTIEYYDTTSPLNSSTLAWGNSYKNLIINKPASLDDVVLTVSKTTTIAAGTTNAVNLNNANNSFGGTIYLGNSAAATPVNAGAVTLKASSPITLENNANADSLTLNCPATVTNITTTGSQTYNGQITLAANATLTASGASSQINLNENVNGSDKTLTIASGSKAVLAAGITVAPSVINNGTISCSGAITFGGTVNNTGSITCSGAATFEKSYSGTGASLTLSNNTTTFKADLDLSGTTFAHGKGTVKLIPASTSVNISGNNTFYNFTAGTTVEGEGLGGKTIIFQANSTQKVTRTLTLNGTSETSRLLLRSSTSTTETTSGTPWIIKCTAASDGSHQIQYVNIQDSNNISNTSLTDDPAEAYNLYAMDSWDNGYNTNWNFPEMPYTWQGGTNESDTNWGTASYWSPASVPGKGSFVTIPAGKTSYPVLTDTLNLKYNDSYAGSITIENGGKFDLAGQNLTVGTITNKGLVRLTGASTQTIHATMENDGSDSTVEYYGTGTANSNFAWDGNNGASATGKQYKNLIISRAMSQNTDESNKLDVFGTTTIIAGNDNSVSLDNSYNIFGGHVTLGKQSPATSAGTVILNGTGTSDVAIYLEENVLAQNLTLNSNVQGENLTITASLTLNAASITTTGTQTYKDSITLGNVNAHALSGTQIIFAETGALGGSDKLTLSGNMNNNGTWTYNTQLEITGNLINSNGKSATFKEDISVTGNVSDSGTWTQPSGKKLSFNGTNTQTFTVNTSNSYRDVVVDKNTGTLAITGKLTADNFTTKKAITFNGNIEIETTGDVVFEKTVTSIANLTITADKLKFQDVANVNNITMNATATTSSNITVTGNWTNNKATGGFKASNGTVKMTSTSAVTLSGKNTFNTLTLQGPVTLSDTNTITNLIIQDSVTLSANNTITNLTADTAVNGTTGLGGKTITFGYGTEQSISGDLILKGTAYDDNKRLLLVSSEPGSQWEIKCGATSTQNIEYVDVKDSKNTSDYYLFAIHSWDSGKNTKWNFPGMKYVWEGTANNNWNNAANWKHGSIPGKGADIEIPAGCGKYPELIVDLDLNDSYGTPSVDYKGKITVDANAQFNLAGKNLTLGEIINNGLARLTGASGQTISGKMTNGTGSKVEYYGTGATTTNFAWDGDGAENGDSADGKQYANLILNQDTSSSETLEISETLTINNPAELSGAVSVTGTTTLSAGTGKTVLLDNASNSFTGNVIAGSSTDTSFIAGAVTLRAGSLITLADNANADSLTVNSAVKLQKVTTSEEQTYNGAVTVNGTTNLIATDADKHIYFNNNVSGTGTLSAQATNININCEKIETTGNQTYTGAVALDKNTELKSTSGGISFTSTVDGAKTLKLTSNTGTTFGGVVGGTVGAATNLTSLEVNGRAIINTSSITTSGAQTYNGAVTLGADTRLTSTGSNITLNTTLNGAHTITFSVPNNAANTITVVGEVGGDSNITTPPSITIAQAGNTTFKETVKANVFTLTKANSTTFEKAVDITSFADDTTNHTGTVTFAAGGTIQNNVTFNTNNNVTFVGIMNIGAETSRKDLKHTAGDTIINGIIFAATTQINNLILTGDTEISTTGAQTYNGTINDQTSGAHTLELNAGTSQITFNGNVGNTAIKTLTVTGPLTVNCELIKTTGAQLYNSPVVISSGTTETITSTGDGIHFVDTVTINDDTTISVKTSHQIVFDKAVTGDAASSLTTNATTVFNTNAVVSDLTTLTTNAANINSASITTSGSQTYNGAVTIGVDTTLTSTSDNIALALTLDGAYKITFSVPDNTTNTITVAGKVGGDDSITTPPSITIAQAGNVSFAQTVRSADFTITLANDSQFAKPVTVTNFKIATANDTHFADTLTADTFEITHVNDTQFDNTVTASTFKITQAANTTFDGVVTIASFTDAATAGNISFNAGGTISAATGTTFLTTGTVTFGDNQSDIMTFGSASPYADLKHTAGNTNITGLINAANITLAQTACGPMTIANSGLFKTIDGAALTYTTSFTQNGTGNSVIGGSFTGNGNASFATNVQLYGSSQADFGSSGNAVSIAKNLIILRAATDDLNINSRVNVTENLVLYKGPVVANADITAGKDILILGSAYSTTDTSTGITNEYAYDCVRPETWSQVNYVETVLPDGTTAPSTSSGTPVFTSTLSVASGTTISAGKNFYANGTTLQTAGATGQWELKLPDLTNPSNGFAEAYHSQISGCKVIFSDGTSSGSKARLVALECTDAGDNATSVDFDDFDISAAYTERDNVIRVEFNRPIRFNSSTIDLLKFHDSSDAVSASTNFTGFYTDPDCQHQINIGANFPSYTNGGNTYYYLYVKASPQDSAETGAWNTDATGKDGGTIVSTDRNGNHHSALPCLDFPRSLQATASGQAYTVPFILTDIWGKRLNNYSRRVIKGSTAEAAYGSVNSTNDVLDKTGPVLWKVRTGQELHNAYDTSTGQASEHSYDAHNFIEFLYSEKVDFDGDETTNAALNADPSTAENVKVTSSFGALQNSDIKIAGALNFAGLGTIQNGLLWTGREGNIDKEVNALYRKGDNAEYSIRLSIAGYTEGTVTDPDGNTYKKWIGYIEKAQMPTGTVTHIVDVNKQNTFVKDKEGNPQIEYETLNMIPEVDSTEVGLYGKWDLSEPVFAPVRANKDTLWIESQLFKDYYEAEAVGNNSGVGSTLDRIEFHLFDNTPEFDEEGKADVGTPEWFTEVGWCNQDSEGEKATDLYKSYTYAADIFGGARSFDTESRRTSGGIRYSTIHSAVNAFKYGVSSSSNLPENLIKTAFDTSKHSWGGASSLIFTGSSSPRRSAGDLEGLYFSLPLENTSLDIKTRFVVRYNDKEGFITDLAGNRLRTKIISTIDRTPPGIDMTICAVGGDELDIIFVKQLCKESNELYYFDNGNQIDISEDFKTLITKCFDFITIDSSGSPNLVTDLAIKSVLGEIDIFTNQNGSSFTKIRFQLSRKVTLEDIKNTYIRVNCFGSEWKPSTDKFTGHPNSNVTFIQDAHENGNYIQMYTAHALSDFAVGIINPLYAYDSAMTEEDGTIISDSLFRANLTDDVDEKGWAVHDWNRDQKNYGTLPAKRPLAIVADTADGSEENDDAPVSFRLYLSNNPDAASVSTQYNKDLEPDTQWRIWLPNEMSGVFTSLSEKNNTNYSQVDGTLLSDDISNRMIFDVGQTIVNQWAAGNQISFLFGLTNSDGTPVTIMHSPELDINNDKQYLSTSAKMPLFALRQTEPANLMSLDLWSFRLKDVVSQRGGVTILNNVINSSQREKVVVKVNQPQQGNLTVLVMTLDGSIVDYLHRGSSEAGEHFYSWDGTNRRGHSVARGMYFIRVTGPGIDETRKVMVVKD